MKTPSITVTFHWKGGMMQRQYELLKNPFHKYSYGFSLSITQGESEVKYFQRMFVYVLSNRHRLLL